MKDLLDLNALPHPTGQGPDGSRPDDPLDEEAVSEEEQAQYEQFIVIAMQFVHGAESRDVVIDHLNDNQVSIPEAVGRTAAFIVQRVSESAKAQGAELSPDVVFHAGQEIVEELFEVGATAGIFEIELPAEGEEPSPEVQQMMEQAFAIGAHEYGKAFVQTEEGKATADEAGTYFAKQVANEADEGRLDPRFAEQFGGQPGAARPKRALVQEE